LNLNGTFNVDSLLYKLLDANLDNYPNHLIKSQLNELRNLYKKEAKFKYRPTLMNFLLGIRFFEKVTHMVKIHGD